MNGRHSSEIIENREISPGIFDLRLEFSGPEPKPGQFFMLYTGDNARLLPRPISVCGYEGGVLRLVYRVAGAGTAIFSKLAPGNKIDVLGPLGNGYPVPLSDSSASVGSGIKIPETAVLIGGGIGLPPLLYLGKCLSKHDPREDALTDRTDPASAGTASGHPEIISILGYRDSEMFLRDEFEEISALYISTDDGSFGTKGTVMDVLESHPGLIRKNSVICACGPTPMLRAVRKYALENGISAFVSLEERMACGVGACLSCVCRTAERDDHSNVNNARVCVDGPVFRAEDVILD